MRGLSPLTGDMGLCDTIAMKMTILAGAALLAAFSASAEKLAFFGTTDKNPLEYALNETITFTVTLVDKDNGNAAVTGGKLKLENKTVFGKETDMELAASGVTVALDYSGTMYMRNLTVGGDIKAAGTYGAPGNAAVPAANQLPCFTGTGRILFLGNNRGTFMFFK